MKLKLYQIDAFANHVFKGNPAAVCPLDNWIDDALMQKIANENNLAETAFFVQEEENYRLRWFTPTSEIEMCGHATLASAFVLFEILGHRKEEILFDTLSGILKVVKVGEKYQMDFPALPISKCDLPDTLKNAFDKKPIGCYKSLDYILVFENEEDIISVVPNLSLLKNIDARGVIITAKGKVYDFVNRFFIPKYGIDEDPVTGSAFTQLVPYWNQALDKSVFRAKQLSERGGEVFCELKNNRVEISGYAKKYFEGMIYL